MTVSPVTPASTPEGRAEPDLSGQRLGDYQLLRRLGRGGMAEVYLAEQLSLRRQIALKVLKKSLATDDGYIRRFQHEAQAAAKLVHANIVQIYEVGCIDGTYFISQEYVPGQNLKQLLGRMKNGVDAVQAMHIIWQVAAALGKAAEQKIIHRDVKPENIMISPTGEVKVADFGLARVVRDGEALNLTQVGITMGTPLYMSPEQVEGRSVDPRSDIYSFGVTCYHMLAGHPPFDGDSALAVAVQHLKNEPKRLEILRPDLPEGLCRIVHKMLAKKPEERYQRALDLLKDLRAIKIEGLDQDWVAALPGFNSADLTLASAGRMEATQQLDRVLRSELRSGPQGWSIGSLAWTIAGLVLLGLVSGTALALINRPQPLLPVTQPGKLKVKRFKTVREQYAYAQLPNHNPEEAWQAVTEYFPPVIDGAKVAENQRYAWLAMRGLAGYYLSHNRLAEALKQYEELEKVDPSEVDFHLAGIAGEAIVYHRQKIAEEDKQNPDETALDRLDEQVLQRLAELRPYRTELRRRLGDFLAGEVERLFEEYEKPEGS
jgi:serine/threonine-protein kinase